VFDSVHLEFLIQQMGVDHVVIGTDYPFDMGHYDPLGQIDGVRGVSEEDKDLIRSATASKLLKLDG
jgi:aminocarboxymuconate-semialdehyde decarboxylase